MNNRVFYTRGRAGIIGAAACALAAVGLLFSSVGASATPTDSDDRDAAVNGQSRVLIDSEVTFTPDRSHWNKEQQVDMTGATAGFVQLSAGYFHAAAVSNGGVLYTWGMGEKGQLGNGDTGNKAVPTVVDTTGVLQGVAIKKVAVGRHHTVALSEDGDVYTWGSNDQGQLGDGTRKGSTVPVAVSRGEIPADVEIVDIAAADAVTLAVGSDGRVYEWGNLMEKAPSTDALLVPTLRTGLEGQFVTAVTAGGYDAMVLTDQGTLFGWGSNKLGRLGVGDSSKQYTPVQVNTSGELAGKNIVGVSMNISAYAFPATFAWDSEGQIYSWGSNEGGQLGIGKTGGYSYLPVSVDMSAFEGRKVIDVKSGVAHALALTDDDMIYAWGLNRNTNAYSSGKDGGQLGTGDQVNRLVPERVDMSGELADQAPFLNIGVGAYASFALGNDGKVFSWGTSGQYFLLGDGNDAEYAYSNLPAKGPWIAKLTGVTFETADGSTVIPPDKIERDPSDARAGSFNDYTTLRFTAPSYGEKLTEPRCKIVDVVAEFALMGGESESGITAQWPTAKYKYCADPELSWDSEPTAELEDDADFAEDNTVTFTFAGVASGEASLADTSFVVSEFIGTGSAPEMTCTPDQVAAGESFVCTGTYTLTADDVIKGEVSLTGKVSATYDDEAVEVIGGEKTASLYGEGVDLLVVTFDLNGGGGGDFRALIATPGEVVHVYDHAPVRDGYEFAGWLPVTQIPHSTSVPSGLIKPGSDHTLFGHTILVAQWELESLPLVPGIVTPREPVFSPAEECGVEGTVEIPSMVGVEYAESREGTIVTVTATAVGGWKFSEAAVTQWEFDIEGEECTSENEDFYVVSFDLNGGVGDFRELVATPGERVHVYDHAPVRDGFDFVGWLPVTQMSSPTSVMSDLIKPGSDHALFGHTILVAQWELESLPLVPGIVTPREPVFSPAEECGVEGTVEIPSMVGVEYAESREGTIVTVTATAVDGWKFSEAAVTQWEFDIEGEECTSENEDLYVVSFDLNGGVGDFRELVATPGERVHVYDHAPVRDGFDFVGWLPVTQMSSPTSVMSDLIKPGSDHALFGHTILVAQWEAVETTEPTEPPTGPTDPDTELPSTPGSGGNGNAAGNGSTGSLAETGTNALSATAAMVILVSLGLGVLYVRRNRLNK